jgi:hypothetical protein
MCLLTPSQAQVEANTRLRTCWVLVLWVCCRYNTVMKLVFLGTSCAIVYYMRYHRIIRLSYDKDQDTFRHWMLIAPSALLALVSAHPRSFMEVRQ